jgi:hypothetical protein
MGNLNAISFSLAATFVFTACSTDFKRIPPKSPECIKAEERLGSATRALTLAEITVLHNPAALADGTLEARRAAHHARTSAQSDVGHHCTP